MKPNDAFTDQAFGHNAAPSRLRWLHQQTVLSNPSRRRLWQGLPSLPNARILDVGCGLGMGTADLARSTGAHLTGLDYDNEALDYARQWTHELDLPITFESADVMTCDYPDNFFDGITARFVWQHLQKPREAIRHLAPFLKPGGFWWIEDVDDGYAIDWPEWPKNWNKAIDAFQRLQAQHAGDRCIGRKLGVWLVEAGFEAYASVDVQTSASVAHLHDPNLVWQMQRIADVLPQLAQAQLLSYNEWDSAQAALKDALPRTVYQSAATLLWRAVKI